MDSDNDVVSIDMDDIKKRLLEQRAQMTHDVEMKERQMVESGDDLVPERGGVSNHMADDANDTAEQETQLTLQGSVQRELDQINVALSRIEAGTYGTCANCGKPINPARLEARPSSIYCIDCQELADRGKI
ncbi:MAG: TraR/DksA C4-type zinc finger protein [Chloroflexota bacterium]